MNTPRLILKRAAKIAGITLLSVVAFLCLYFASAYTLSRITVNKQPNGNKEVAIYIKTNGVHTDLVVPVHTDITDWSKEVKYGNTALTDTSYPYLAMGWGDKGFYLQTPNWSDLKFSVAFRAAFALSTTAIHATFYKALPEDAQCHKIMISREQYRQLVSYIAKSFKKDSNGHFIKIQTTANYNDNDAFYEANGTYNLFRTCNTWANNGLKASGQKCCAWTIFDKGIFMKYE